MSIAPKSLVQRLLLSTLVIVGAMVLFGWPRFADSGPSSTNLTCRDATALLSQADGLYAGWYYDSAGALCDAVITGLQASDVGSDSLCAYALTLRGDCQRELLRFENAKSSYLNAIKSYTRLNERDCWGMFRAYEGLGYVFMRLRQLDQAGSAFRQALQVASPLIESHHPRIAQGLVELAGWYKACGDNATVTECASLALETILDCFIDGRLSYDSSLFVLGNLHTVLGMNKEAEQCYRKLRARCRDSLSLSGIGLGTIVCSLADAVFSQATPEGGGYARWVELCEEAVSIAERKYGPNHPMTAALLVELARSHRYSGEYMEPLPIVARALKILEKSPGFDPDTKLRALFELGKNYENLGDCEEALKYLDSAFEFAGQAGLTKSYTFPEILNCFGNVYKGLGKYAEAEEKYLESLKWRTANESPKSPNIGEAATNLGDLYALLGRFSDAEEHYRWALRVRQDYYNPHHPFLIYSLIGLGNLYCLTGSHALARPLFDSALQICRLHFQKNHLHFAWAYKGLADCYVASGDLGKADSLYEKALEIEIATYGQVYADRSAEVAATLESISRLRRLQNRPMEALSLAYRACRIRQKALFEDITFLSEAEALKYSRDLRNSVDQFLSCYFSLPGPDSTADRCAADIIFSTKGQVYDVMSERARAMAESSDSATAVLVDSLRLSKMLLSQIFITGPKGDDKEYETRLTSMNSVVERLETDLARRSISFAEGLAYQDVSAESVASRLPDSTVLLEYLHFQSSNIRGDSGLLHYLVVILQKDSKPVTIDLGPGARIDKEVSRYRDHVNRLSGSGRAFATKDTLEYRQICTALGRFIWQPLALQIPDGVLVLVAPDGALHQVSFAGLLDDEKKYLIESHPIHYVSAARDLLRFKEKSPSGRGLLAMGDPDYDACSAERVSFRPTSQAISTVVSSQVSRGTPSWNADIVNFIVPPLPETAAEIDAVIMAWRANFDEPAVRYLGADASENRFFREAPGYRVLHLAVHGFFLDRACSFGHPGISGGGEPGAEICNPLLLSGLLFAGFNRHDRGCDDSDLGDGVLTACEVSALDLRGVDLVVLSACESGLGRIQDGEGLNGLCRAFEMAGARAVVSTLWQIPDNQQTVELMSKSYERKHGTLPAMMQSAQLEQIQALRTAGLPDHPVSWAAFTSTGDWR